ncbi:ATPase [Candidatus Shapirobacteria bacterium CG08_land_8_20_14_0_20_39_18]|uniref:ATPase n=1 Tax=Candidatus Shapirobacteria bacterium CG08_land_8_20_14_0_20_39_18 TaxID=1974883 RepID=A0A2M6XE12_9BACT|nr:MAG: ATPase [Candidatus Shapirobacteria bacterium CG08_land_8_20_14_0_20_39_18]PJE68103.1 MAG: ATPase [Candidatus Shapirobacteria bacterium CG10_big_fil_rev_8_21_14_0_10_38_8]
MIKNTVLKQKEVKEQLLSLLYIERTKAVEARKWLDSDLIKVVLGPRRAGKSVFSLMLLKDRPFAYFNFDDESISEYEKFNYDELMGELKSVYGETKNILFDEIQNLPKWELFVSRLHREGYNLILTGSNARLLSKELSTALTGRHIPIEILPFDFKEFLCAKQHNDSPDDLLRLFGQYLVSGGYPEVTVKNLDPKEYLKVLFDSLLFKDVVKRHKVRFSELIDSLGSYLINNVSSQYSLRKLTSVLGFKSGVTLEKYMSYLTEAYITFSFHRYSFKAGERIKSPKKIYVVDNGFVTAKAVQFSPDNGKLLENLVFTELVKQGLEPNREIFYYKTRNDREIDFVLKSGSATDELIQVVYETNSPDTERREVKALLEASGELGVKNLTILTWNEKKVVNEDGLTVNFVPAWERFSI